MTNLDSIWKRRDIILPTKVHLVKAMVFPMVMYGCESWTIKKAECQRIDAFELWCWRRLLRVPWTARKSNQSIPKEISPEYSLEGLKLMLKLQYFGHLMLITDSLEKTLMLERLKAEGERDNRGWDGWMASLTRWTWIWVNSRSWRWTGRPGVLQSMGSQRVGHNWENELNWSDWIDPRNPTLCLAVYLHCDNGSVRQVLLSSLRSWPLKRMNDMIKVIKILNVNRVQWKHTWVPPN